LEEASAPFVENFLGVFPIFLSSDRDSGKRGWLY